MDDLKKKIKIAEDKVAKWDAEQKDIKPTDDAPMTGDNMLLVMDLTQRTVRSAIARLPMAKKIKKEKTKKPAADTTKAADDRKEEESVSGETEQAEGEKPSERPETEGQDGVSASSTETDEVCCVVECCSAFPAIFCSLG